MTTNEVQALYLGFKLPQHVQYCNRLPRKLKKHLQLLIARDDPKYTTLTYGCKHKQFNKAESYLWLYYYNQGLNPKYHSFQISMFVSQQPIKVIHAGLIKK